MGRIVWVGLRLQLRFLFERGWKMEGDDEIRRAEIPFGVEGDGSALTNGWGCG